ncbi:MAG: hypothetical protein H6729_04795 [Deltaproteobacteria bacterium]|nr:hypothetical protein [Deltaproteobacteria bacterium]
MVRRRAASRALACPLLLRLVFLTSALAGAAGFAGCGGDEPPGGAGSPPGSNPDAGLAAELDGSTSDDASSASSPDATSSVVDAGERDAGRSDGAVDGGTVDGSAVDGGAVDGGAVDGSAVDGGAVDGGAVDGGAVDGGAVDGSAVDGGVVDGGAVDGGAADGGAPDDRVAELDLGLVSLANGFSDALDFDLPDGLATFTVVIEGSENDYYIVSRLDGPTGVLVTDQESGDFGLPPFPAQYNSPNRVVSQREGIGTALFPNNPGVSVVGGHYTMTIAGVTAANQSPVDATVRVRVLLKVGDTSEGRLDLSLYFSGAAGLQADNAPSSTLVLGAIEQLRTIYAAAGIEIGTIAYYDVDARFRTIASMQGAGNDLNQLFQQSAGHGPGLHFFFVDRIENPLGFGTIGGVAGGLPGPPRSQGSTGAGVAVAVGFANDDAELLAHVMGHEGGHWLGLSHTQEIFFSIEDQLPDTVTGQAGRANLMYPEASASAGHQISPNQATVMRYHIETVNP